MNANGVLVSSVVLVIKIKVGGGSVNYMTIIVIL